jgi:hypothetical protein
MNVLKEKSKYAKLHISKIFAGRVRFEKEEKEKEEDTCGYEIGQTVYFARLMRK